MLRKNQAFQGYAIASFLRSASELASPALTILATVCNDKNLITKKVKERFGTVYSKLIDYLLLLENEKFNAKTLAVALSNRELEDGFFRFEPNNLYNPTLSTDL